MDASRSSIPGNKVFTTHELLENILSFLKTNDLAKAQEVCKIWQAIIARSPRLRQHLFLEPEPSEPGFSYINRRRYDSRLAMLKLHPLLSHLKVKKVPCSYPGEEGCVPREEDWHCMLDWPTIKRILKMEGEVWKSMLVTQPPPQKLYVATFEAAPRVRYTEYFEDPAGVKMGVLRDALHRMKRFVPFLNEAEENDRKDMEGCLFIVLDGTFTKDDPMTDNVLEV